MARVESETPRRGQNLWESNVKLALLADNRSRFTVTRSIMP
jgi:hypothetical protein